MTQDELSTLSAEKHAAVERALAAAFDAPVREPLTVVTGGMSGAAVFRLRVEGAEFLLRVEAPADAFRDPARSLRCMQIAADAGLAPRVRFACIRDGVTIMDFIRTRPLAAAFGDRAWGRAEALGRMIGALHAAPPFPPLMDYLEGLELLMQTMHGHVLLPVDEVAPTFEACRQLTSAYRRLAPDPVSSHNDINPGNILYDGVRLWLVDWDSAFLADRYIDLASAITFFTRAADEEAVLLAAYFGRAPTAAEQARLYLAKQINHLFYGVMFLNAAAAVGAGRGDLTDAPAPKLADVHRALAGEAFDLGSREGRVIYGRARLNAARDGVADPRFDRAVRGAR